MPQMFEIDKVVQEAKGVKSFFFKNNIDSKPGQFIMVWIPGLDERPMAVSYKRKDEFAFTTQKVGKFTHALLGLKKGDKVGIRGPYGNCFSAKDNACIVGGGIGMAPLSALIDVLKNPAIINGARNKELLLYLKRFKNQNMLVATDDGSYGRKGFTTDILDELLGNNDKNKIKIVYTCGPEIMMKKAVDICTKHKIDCEASLERIMKCGFGVCGSCMCNSKLVCKDGPVFTSEQLNEMPDFGSFARLKSGRKVALKDYHSSRS
ncbi:dihydroorotate dehydrogenase electron transfer subunit [Candidatus Woesearchaeota archaeon]|nr:dihydroorotate dehydrogenase electron transfer subunit [Candidatus Woesearchaeota archaeon]